MLYGIENKRKFCRESTAAKLDAKAEAGYRAGTFYEKDPEAEKSAHGVSKRWLPEYHRVLPKTDSNIYDFRGYLHPALQILRGVRR